MIELLQKRYGDDLDTLVLGMLGGTLVVVGVATLLRSLFLAGVIQERSAMHLYRRHIIAAVITGITTGFVIGLTSAGSGTLIAIALIAIFRLTPQRVVGTDVFHAAVLLWAAGIAHWVGGNIDFLLAGTILVGSIPGVIIGTGLSVKAPQKFLRYALAVVLIASGTTLVLKNYEPGIVFPAIGVAAIMVGLLFGAQAFSRGRSKGPRAPAGAAAYPRPPTCRRSRLPAMFVFASAVTDPDVYARAAAAGVGRLREDDPSIEQIVFASVGSIFRNYNLIIDQVKDRDDVEALVLIHQDAEIQDPGFVDKVRAALEDPEVAIVGCAGAVDVRSIAWWEGSITWASFTHRYDELGGGEIPAFSWMTESLPPYARLGEVDSIDGFVMALSPWAMRNLRFDESLGRSTAMTSTSACRRATAGKKVVTADLQVVHHHSLRLIDDPETWINAYMRVAEKWDAQIPHNGSRDATGSGARAGPRPRLRRRG